MQKAVENELKQFSTAFFYNILFVCIDFFN